MCTTAVHLIAAQKFLTEITGLSARNVDRGVCETKLHAIDWRKLPSELTINDANLTNCCKITLAVMVAKKKTFETAGRNLVLISYNGSKYFYWSLHLIICYVTVIS